MSGYTNEIEIGETYRIYGRMKGMRRFAPINGDGGFAVNLIYALFFVIKSEIDQEQLRKELEFLNTQGEFKLKKVV